MKTTEGSSLIFVGVANDEVAAKRRHDVYLEEVRPSISTSCFHGKKKKTETTAPPAAETLDNIPLDGIHPEPPS